jgi:hypothetical protein
MILSTLHRTDALRVASAVRCFGASNHDHNYDDTNGSEKAAEVTVQGSNQTMPCIIIDDGLESQMLISRERFLIGYIAMHEVSWLNWAPGHNTYHKQAIKAAGSWYEPDLREWFGPNHLQKFEASHQENALGTVVQVIGYHRRHIHQQLANHGALESRPK